MQAHDVRRGDEPTSRASVTETHGRKYVSAAIGIEIERVRVEPGGEL
jgi:hypothetical protein